MYRYETAYLLGNPNNAKRLRRAIRQLDAGKGRVRKLIPTK
jgi:PHD/YefM family antitoxin component YafN of YafNO toxin-antitoxin module